MSHVAHIYGGPLHRTPPPLLSPPCGAGAQGLGPKPRAARAPWPPFPELAAREDGKGGKGKGDREGEAFLPSTLQSNLQIPEWGGASHGLCLEIDLTGCIAPGMGTGLTAPSTGHRAWREREFGHGERERTESRGSGVGGVALTSWVYFMHARSQSIHSDRLTQFASFASPIHRHGSSSPPSRPGLPRAAAAQHPACPRSRTPSQEATPEKPP